MQQQNKKIRGHYGLLFRATSPAGDVAAYNDLNLRLNQPNILHCHKIRYWVKAFLPCNIIFCRTMYVFWWPDA